MLLSEIWRTRLLTLVGRRDLREPSDCCDGGLLLIVRALAFRFNASATNRSGLEDRRNVPLCDWVWRKFPVPPSGLGDRLPVLCRRDEGDFFRENEGCLKRGDRRRLPR